MRTRFRWLLTTSEENSCKQYETERPKSDEISTHGPATVSFDEALIVDAATFSAIHIEATFSRAPAEVKRTRLTVGAIYDDVKSVHALGFKYHRLG